MSGFLGNLHGRVMFPAAGDPTGTYKVVTSAADVCKLSPGAPVQIVRWGFIATTTVNDGTNGLKLTGDLRVTAGSDTGRVTGASTSVASQTGYNASNQPAYFVDTAGGSITLTASTTQVVAGKGVYHNLAPQATQSSGYYPNPDTSSGGGVDTQLVIYPGQEFIIKVQATAPSAGAGILFIEYKELPFQGDSQLPAGLALTPSNSISNMTKVTS